MCRKGKICLLEFGEQCRRRKEVVEEDLSPLRHVEDQIQHGLARQADACLQVLQPLLDVVEVVTEDGELVDMATLTSKGIILKTSNGYRNQGRH
jgi:hypothetical protein